MNTIKIPKQEMLDILYEEDRAKGKIIEDEISHSVCFFCMLQQRTDGAGRNRGSETR